MSVSACIKEVLLSEYLDGELSADAAKNVQQHLSCCEDCSAVYNRLKADRHLLLEYLPDPNPPAHMKQQILHRINAESESRKHSGIMSWIGLGQPLSSTSRAWAAAAACVVLLAAVLSAFQVQQHLEKKEILAEIDRSRAQLAARDFSLNPFNIDIQGAPLQVTTENPFKSFLDER